MSITLGEIVTEVTDMFSDDYLTTARVKRQIGLVVRDTEQRTDHQFLHKEATFDTVTNQSDYDMSTAIPSLDGQKIIRIVPPSSTWREVEYLPYDQFYEAWPKWLGTQYGDPFTWTWEDWQIIRFRPIPNSVMTMTVYYHKTMTEIDDTSADSTEIDVPDKYRNVIVEGALWRCARMVDDDRARLFLDSYEEAKARMCFDLAPTGIGVRPDSRLL